MSYRREIELDLMATAIFPELLRLEISAINDIVGHVETVDDAGYELDCRPSGLAVNRLCFYPLCELVDSDQEILEAVPSSLQRSYHIQPPDRKRPCDGDHLQGCCWYVTLLGKAMALIALPDEVVSVLPGCWPEETVLESFANRSPRCSVMPTGAGVNFFKNFPAFFRRYTALEYTGDTVFVELSINRGVRLRLAYNAPSLLLVFWELAPQQVSQDGLGPGQDNNHDIMGRASIVGPQAPGLGAAGFRDPWL